jgi:hypothetical protein
MDSEVEVDSGAVAAAAASRRDSIIRFTTYDEELSKKDWKMDMLRTLTHQYHHLHLNQWSIILEGFSVGPSES